MLKKNPARFMFLAAFTVLFITSCKKEEVLASPGETGSENNTVIYIRAVNKDSSVVESQQVLLK
jgi:hypothetical protein